MCKRCLVSSPAQPRRLQPFLLNGASAEPRGSSARRSRGDLAPERVRHTPLCSDSWGSFPSASPVGLRAPGDAPLPLPHLQPLCSAAFLWKHGNKDTRHRHHPGASASPPTPVPPPPAPAVTSCCGIRRDKGNVFMENLHPIEIFWERSAWTASCHAMNLIHPELRDSPACPAKGFQSCTPRPRPRLCTPTPPCPCVSLSHPVAPQTLRACAHPSLDLWGLGGDQEPITSPLAVPSHPPLLGVLCHLCKYLCVLSCVPAVLG